MTWLDSVVLTHNRICLALHQLRGGSGTPLLLLHGLGEQTPSAVPAEIGSWRGPVWGLDFTGHGRSTIPDAGGYTCELLMADADHALAHLGQATLYGRGLGGYVGLLLAGARPTDVRGVIIADGPGLAGGGASPSTAGIVTVSPDEPVGPPDPYALQELSRDARAVDYAVSFARDAVQGSDLPSPIVVTAIERPAWLAGVIAEVRVEVLSGPLGALGRFGDTG